MRLRIVPFIDSYLGHGRMLESALILVKFQYAVILFFVSPDSIYVRPFEDIAWKDAWVLGIPFLLAASLQTAGLVSNIYGISYSRFLRIAGACIGMAMWIFMLLKTFYLGYPVDGLNPWMLMGVIGSLLIIRKAVLNLPPPGSRGLV
jgi:hypothetical protein